MQINPHIHYNLLAMAFDLAYESSYFKRSIFEERYGLKTYSKIDLHSIRTYIHTLWLLQYNYTKLPHTLYVQIIQYIISVYDRGFRMPKENDPIQDFTWPKAVPLEYLNREMPQLELPDWDLPTNKKPFFLARSGPPDYTVTVGSLKFILMELGQPSTNDEEVIYVHHMSTRTMDHLDSQQFLFMSGRIPVLWENASHILINVTQHNTCHGTHMTYGAIVFAFILKATGNRCMWLRTDRIADLNIDPQVLLYATQNFTLNKIDAVRLRKYIDNYTTVHL